MGELTLITDGALPMPVRTPGLYEAFLAGRSVNTREAYARDMMLFAGYLGDSNPKDALSRILVLSHGEANGTLLAFKAAMLEEGLTPATINRRLSAVKSAVKLGRTLGLTNWVPEIGRVKAQSFRDTHGPGLEGTRSMLNMARTQGVAAAARDAAIIRLFFDLALRRAEVVGMDVADIDVAGRRVWFIGKGKTQKEYKTLPEKTVAALDAWLVVRASIAAPDQTALFVALDRHSKGKRISGRGVHYIISHLGEDVGIKTRPHGLRHASITTALDQNNGDVRAAQQHARHSDPRTTIVYDDNRRDLAGRTAAGLADVL
jgi:integrase/recombinase XerC